MGIFGKKTEDAKNGVTEKAVAKDVVAEKDKKVKKSSKKDEVASITSAYGTIVAPIITEKTHDMVAKNKYTFRVAKGATKLQVKDVIEEMYSVHVESINTVVVKPKRRTVKYNRGYQKLYKKAIVTVREGDHIAVFEGA